MRSMQHKHIPLVLTVLFSVFLVAASSPQCARTDETALSPTLQTSDANTCIQDCQAAFKAAKKEEQARFKEAKKACNGDEGCQAEETAIHAAINKEINADKDACIQACNHSQGGGSGGQ